MVGGDSRRAPDIDGSGQHPVAAVWHQRLPWQDPATAVEPEPAPAPAPAPAGDPERLPGPGPGAAADPAGLATDPRAAPDAAAVPDRYDTVPGTGARSGTEAGGMGVAGWAALGDDVPPTFGVARSRTVDDSPAPDAAAGGGDAIPTDLDALLAADDSVAPGPRGAWRASFHRWRTASSAAAAGWWRRRVPGAGWRRLGPDARAAAFKVGMSVAVVAAVLVAVLVVSRSVAAPMHPTGAGAAGATPSPLVTSGAIPQAPPNGIEPTPSALPASPERPTPAAESLVGQQTAGPTRSDPPAPQRAAPPPAHPATAGGSVNVSGQVSCTSGRSVEGVWVQAGTGSGWAPWQGLGNGSTSDYWYTLPTAEPYALHVGCGGSTANWATANYSSAVSGTQNSFNCIDVNTDPAYGKCVPR
jgi:hypothetical protein